MVKRYKWQAGDGTAMTYEEAFATFDNAARRYLSMSGDEFLKKWRSGYFKGKRDLASRIDAVSILLPIIERGTHL